MICVSEGSTWLSNFEPASVDVVYTDPPFRTGRIQSRGDFAYDDSLTIGQYTEFVANLINSCVKSLRPGGALWFHCDDSADWLIRSELEKVQSITFQNAVVWNYYNKISNASKRFAGAHDALFLYSKRGGAFRFTPQVEQRESPVKMLRRKSEAGKIVNAKDENGRCQYIERTTRGVNDVWRIPALQPASREWLGYPTQKPLALLERVVLCTSAPGDLIIDPTCGSGTTLAAAKRLGRRWAGADLSSAAVEMATARLESIIE